MMPSLVPSSALAAVAPSAQMAFGCKTEDLPEQELPAGLHLVRLRRPVLRRAALDDVADVDVLAADRDPFLGGCSVDHLGEQLARATDERQALRVFVRARALANEHQPRLRIP